MFYIMTCVDECAECGTSVNVVGAFDSQEAANEVEVKHMQLHKNFGHNFPAVYVTGVKMNEVNNHSLRF